MVIDGISAMGAGAISFIWHTYLVYHILSFCRGPEHGGSGKSCLYYIISEIKKPARDSRFFLDQV